MQAPDVRTISSMAPLRDLEAGIAIMLLCALFAHAAILPRLGSYNPRIALALLIESLLGVLAVAATVVIAPRKLYLAGFTYVAVFVVIAGIASRHALEKARLRKHVLLGAALMAASVAVAWWMAFAPR